MNVVTTPDGQASDNAPADPRKPPAFPGLRFVFRLALWGALYAALVSVYNRTYDAISAVAVHQAQIRPAAALIRWTLPGESVRADGDSIISSTCRIALLRGCDGVEAWLLLASALLVFPAPWGRRLLGVAVGAALVFGLNLIRIVTLFHLVRFKPDWFEVAHGLVWQTLMMVAVGWFVWIWMRDDPVSPARPEAAAS
jgi:exosortase family protein XrtM